MKTNESSASKPFRFRLLCVCLAALTGCTTGRAPYVWHDLGAQKQRETLKASQETDSWGADAESATSADPQVAPGFLLGLSSLQDKKLNGEFRVDFDGDLELPYNVSLNTAGLSLSQLKKKLGELYKPYFKDATDIDLRVRERRYFVDVRGLVQKPGRYLIEQKVSLDQVINAAGGMNREMPPQFVRIQKGQKSFVMNLNQYYSRGESHPQIAGWLGGEIVFLQKEVSDAGEDRLSSSPYRLPIYLMGEVRKPGEYPARPGADFVDSLILANGFTDRADLDRIEVIRRSGGRKRAYQFSWWELERAPTPIQGDLFIVHADSRVKFDRWIQVATLLVSLVTSVAIVYELERNNNNNRRP